MSDLTGKTIDGGSGAGAVKTAYAVSELIAQNGKTYLYKAAQTGTNQEVFIKYFVVDEINPETAQKIRSKFEVEAQILVDLNHPSMADAIDFGFVDGNPFLVMKFIQMKTIESRYGKKVHSGEVAKMFGPISRALNYCNKKGVSLRDIHPGTIWINQVGDTILGAYSIPTAAEVNGSSEADISNAVYTRPNYLAPEQWKGKVSEQSDVYSLGVVAYELLTGQKFLSQEKTEDIMSAQLAGVVPQPIQYVPDLSDDMQGVVASTLAVNPDERYADGARLAIAYERISHRETNWYTEQVQETVAAKKKAKKSYLRYGIIAAVIILIVLVVVFVATRKQGGGEETRVAAATSTSESSQETAPADDTTVSEATATPKPTKASMGATVSDVYVGSIDEALAAYDSGASTIDALIGDTDTTIIKLTESQQILWTDVWCAATEEILVQNMASFTYNFTIDGLAVDLANIAEKHFTNDEGLQCAEKIILLDKLPAGKTKLVMKQQSLKAVDNGVEVFQPRQYYERYTIEISE